MRIHPGTPELSEAARARLEALIGSDPDPDLPRRAAPDPDEAPEPAPVEETEPEGWQDRLRAFTHRHALVIALVALGIVCLGAWNVLRARPVEVTGSPAVTPAVSRQAPTPTPSAPARIVVHVRGAVARPGVIELRLGDRVADAIERCGGVTPDADPQDLNLAAILSDGDQIVIGTRDHPLGEVRNGAGGAAASGVGGSAAPAAQVDLNTATQAQLESVPGIGPVTAGKILAWRQQHGRFTRVEELGEVDGIGPKTLAQLKQYVRV